MQFIGMAGRDGVAEIEEFVDNLDVDGFPHLIDEDGSVWEQFGVRSQPSFVFIDDDGTIEVVNRALGEDGLAERLDQLAAS